MQIRLDQEGRRYAPWVKGAVFVAEATYNERVALKEAHFRWSPTLRCWWTPDAEKAARLSEHATEEARATIQGGLQRVQQAVEASAAQDTDLNVPCPPGLALRGYQRAGVAYARERRGTLIADEMGLGKTVQAIGLVNCTPAIRSVLVVCPSSLRVNWSREIGRWCTRNLTVGIVDKCWPSGDIVVVSYDVLSRYRPQVDARHWDLLVCDEAHYLKNYKAQRTMAVVGRWDRDPEKRVLPIQADRIAFLTGTPLLNKPIEMWTLIHHLDPEHWRNWRTYVTRYCGAHQDGYGWDVSGATNLEELQRKLRETVMVRRLKKDVEKELPPKVRQLIVLPANGACGCLAEERASQDRVNEAYEQAKAAVELAKAGTEEEYQAAVKALSSARLHAFDEIAKARHATAVAKAPAVAEHVEECLESQEKVVVFAHHLDVIDLLMHELHAYGPVKLTGDMNMKDRQESVDRFQQAKGCRVFVGSIKAAGVGLTLTAASHVVFAELDWVPGNVTQAEDRCHRIGQTDTVLVQHVVLEDSIDERLAKVLLEKQAIAERTLDGGGQSIEDATAEIDLSGIEAATKRTSRDALQQVAEKLTAEQIAAIHTCLQILARLDPDHASYENGIGYNSPDGRIGHSLATRPSLSPRQAALGRIVLKKYHRQLPEDLYSTIYQEANNDSEG